MSHFTFSQPQSTSEVKGARIASRKASWHPGEVQTNEIEHQKMRFYPKHALALSRPNLLKSQDWMGSVLICSLSLTEK